jgi:lipid-binding SYLF domain-containing protein
MNTRFTPAKLSAAIVTLSLMSAPLYTVADEQGEAAQNLEEVKESAEDRPLIEEQSYDTQRVAQELNEMPEETEQAAEEAEQETEQAASEIEQETEQAAAEAEQETEQAAAELEQESEQATAELEQETEEAAAETEQAAAELDNEEGIVEGETVAENEEMTADEEVAAATAAGDDEELSGPMEDVQESASIIQQMQADADLQQVLDQAKGVFVVPDYAVGALIVGASGGEGVLLKKQEAGEWSNPVFYDIGSISAGLQAGAAAGSIAMILLSENAMDAFREDTNFGFTADAGYSIINWSERARAEIGLGTDAVVWTDTEGLFGELAVGVTGITPDEEEIAEYYNKEAEPAAILAGEIENPHQQVLQQALKEQ